MKKMTDSIEEISKELRSIMPNSFKVERSFELSSVIERIIKNNKILNKFFER